MFWSLPSLLLLFNATAALSWADPDWASEKDSSQLEPLQIQDKHLENADFDGKFPNHLELNSEPQAIFESTNVGEGGPKYTVGYVPLPAENPSKSFWLDTPGANPLAEEGSTGELTKDADVCVIGSGITGVSAAWHLSKLLGETAHNESNQEDDIHLKPRKVVILEARRFCSGATGRNGGHLTPIVFSGFSALESLYNTSEALKSYALEAHTADSIVRFIKEKGVQKEVDLVEGGHLTLLRNNEEELGARKDWEGVKNAGKVGPEGRVEWIGKEELVKKYHVDHKLGYTAVHQRGHNLWPCKAVTHFFKDTQSSSNLTHGKQRVSVALHTKTPVTAISKLPKNTSESDSDYESSDGANDLPRRWSLHTPRGATNCAYVVHATNGYASHLLPFISGIEEDANTLAEYGLNEKPGSLPGSHEAHTPSQSQTEPLLPRGAYGIRPTRGQVGAVRASVNTSTLGWLTSWDGGNGGDEYWFPRYQDADTIGHSTIATDTSLEQEVSKNPLIILGGGRYASGPTKEVGVWDDSTLNPSVSKAIRNYLPALFPQQFVRDGAWEIEWSGIMAFTKSGDPFVGPVRQIGEGEDQSENQYEGQYISAGYSGHGMPRAYACAEAVAGMIAAQIEGKDWKIPSWLPERYLTWATKP